MSCYNLEIAGIGNNVHIVWQRYHQAAWSDIYYMGNETYEEITDPIDDNEPDENIDDNSSKSPGFDFYLPIIVICGFIVIIGLIKRKKEMKF